jgi:TRAP-type C4-dicarboxylate transport system permease small subunit
MIGSASQRVRHRQAVGFDPAGWLQRIVRAGTLVSAYALLGAALLVCADVIARKAFNVSLGGADEISGYALAVSTAWAAAFATFERSHIRVDVAYRLAPLGLRAWLDVLACASLLLFAALLSWFAGLQLIESAWFRSVAYTPLRTPLWAPQSLWVAGIVLFAAASLALLLRTGRALLRGDFAAVQRLAGNDIGAQE